MLEPSPVLRHPCLGMARGAEIEGFPEKLGLALGRANLSRAQAAQMVGVDKSIISRWLSGGMRPADHSLASLSAGLAQRIEGFSRADWEAPLASFARRLGVEAALPAPPAPIDIPFSPLPLALEATADTLALAEAGHAGIWLFLYVSVSGVGRLMGYGARIRRPPGSPALVLEFTNGGAAHGIGPAFVMQGRLYAMMSAARRRDSLGFFLLNSHVDDKLVLLDGVTCMRDGGLGAAPAAAYCMLIRVSDATDDATLARVVERANARTAEHWERLLPAAALAAFLDPASSTERLRLLRVAGEASWALREANLQDSGQGDRRALVERVRELLGDPLPAP